MPVGLREVLTSTESPPSHSAHVLTGPFSILPFVYQSSWDPELVSRRWGWWVEKDYGIWGEGGNFGGSGWE